MHLRLGDSETELTVSEGVPDQFSFLTLTLDLLHFLLL